MCIRDSVHTPSIARWKACGRLPIRHKWTFFAPSYHWNVISGNLSKLALFERGGSFRAQISDKRGRRPPTTVAVRELGWLPFHVVSIYLQCIVTLPRYCDQPICPCVCLSVCPRAYLWNHWTDRHKILCAYPLWPWLGPPLTALHYIMYFRFYGWHCIWP